MTADNVAGTDPAEDATPETEQHGQECKQCSDVVAYVSTDGLCDGCVAEPAQGDNLGDDKLAEMARPYLAPVEQHDELEVHHDAARLPRRQRRLDVPDLRIGRSIFAETARATGELDREWPPLPPPPVIVSGPDGMGAKFDEALAANEDGFIADKVTVAEWARAARVRTHGSAAAA